MKIACRYSKFVTKAKKVYAQLSEKYNFVQEDSANIVLCLGGDGFMLRCLHDFVNSDKIIYGINCGTQGFLLNEINYDKNIVETIMAASEFHIYPLEVDYINDKDIKKSAIAFNEVAFLRCLPVTSHLKITINNVDRIGKLIGDGILIATPLGSTAYNRACGGNVISMNSNLVVMTPINPFHPLNWKGTTLSDQNIIEITNLDLKQRAIKMSSDYHEFNNIKSAIVKKSSTKRVTLLFDKNNDLENKIIKSQFHQ